MNFNNVFLHTNTNSLTKHWSSPVHTYVPTYGQWR